MEIRSLLKSICRKLVSEPFFVILLQTVLLFVIWLAFGARIAIDTALMLLLPTL